MNPGKKDKKVELWTNKFADKIETAPFPLLEKELFEIVILIKLSLYSPLTIAVSVMLVKTQSVKIEGVFLAVTPILQFLTVTPIRVNGTAVINKYVR